MSVEVRREELGVWREGVEGRGDVIVDITVQEKKGEELKDWRCGKIVGAGVEGRRFGGSMVDRAGV